jgi:6-pyruvoyl-tetrahydropterin synthase
MSCGECGSGITAEEKHQIICSGCKHKFSREKTTACPKCKIDIGEMSNPKILDYTYYRCTKKRGPCSQKYISLGELEGQFKNELLKITIDKDYLDLSLEYLNEKQKDFGQEESTLRNSLQRTFDDCQTRLNNLHREYTSSQNMDHSIYSPEEFIGLKNEIVKERDNLKTELEKVTGKLDVSLEATERTFNFCHFALNHFNTGTIQQKREIFSTIGSNITLKDQKITVTKLAPYLIIENGLLEQQRLRNTLEHKNKPRVKGQKVTSVVSVPNWLGR